MLSIQRIHAADSAIVALRPLAAGSSVSLESQTRALQDTIPAKQKFAVRDFASGDHIPMYGVTIGRAKQSIAAGSLLTQGNFAHDTDGFAGKQRDYTWTAPNVST